MKETRYYDLFSPEGILAGTVYADEISTMQARPDAYCTTFGTTFFRRDERLCTVWSDCLSWRSA